jgi:hypothetical protein
MAASESEDRPVAVRAVTIRYGCDVFPPYFQPFKPLRELIPNSERLGTPDSCATERGLYLVILIAMARTAGRAKTAELSGRNQDATSSKMPCIARVVQFLGRMLPERELRQFPKDLSSQVDRNVYGTPKR